ncbi:MAG: DNA polymerase III subunit gamma/tau [Silvanigrellales bacterium]|nr:DNA polymerase III subunit gamma/tau [Silvanigrellales bacterium]
MLEGYDDASGSSTSYQVLARRTRPQSFQELFGQEAVATSLSSILKSGRVPHAFLFTGTRGTGKTSSARILAKSLCCVNGPTLTPCQICHHCVQITACAHEDVLEIDGASNTGVDNVRELREAARFFPNSARFKIFIIDEVHMLSTGAFNALLKTLEEPPPQVVFILATTELHKVPNTVRSRCMIFSFRKVPAEKVAIYIQGVLASEGITYDDDAVALVAREARGSLRDSLSLLEQVIAFSGGRHLDAASARQALSVLGEDLAQSLFAALCGARADDALETLKEADDASIDIATLLDTTATFARNALVLKQVRDAEKAARLTQLLPSEMTALAATTQSLNPVALGEFYRLLSEASRDAARSSNPVSWAEVAVLDCVSRADWLSAGELLALLSQSEGGGATRGSTQESGGTVAPPARNVAVSTPLLQREPSTTDPKKARVEASDVSSKGRVDFPAVAALIAQVEKLSPGLGSKLRHSVFDDFGPHRISFAASPQNALYTDYSETDARHFVGALRSLGYSSAELSGIQLPKGVQWKVTSAEPEAETRGGEPPRLESAVPSRPRMGFLERKPLPEKKNNVTAGARSELPPATPSAAEPKNAPPPAPGLNPAPTSQRSAPNPWLAQGQSSLASHERQERDRAFDEKSRRLLLRPELADLRRAASQVSVLPLNMSSAGSD